MSRERRKKMQTESKDHTAKDAAEFDREFAADTFTTPPLEARKRWERARRKPGRPRRGRGAQVISVSVERELLDRSDALAARIGIPRAALIERGLKAVLAAEGEI